MKALAEDRAARRGRVPDHPRNPRGPLRRPRLYPPPNRHLDLDPAQVLALRAAYVNAGDTGALRWLEHHFDTEYAAGWGLDTLDDITLGTR